MQLRQGSTRWVLLAGPYAFKFPRCSQWRLFLLGLLANKQEVLFGYKGKDPRLCPVLGHVPGGWCCVMRRAIPMTLDQWESNGGSIGMKWFCSEDGVFGCVPAEHNQVSSFGYVNGKVVAVDYGN